jgi:DNA-binding winged helix-turn-helix (wHTH) protein
MRFGEFELDQAGRQLIRAGRPVHVSPKALALLGLLLTRWPAALSKRELEEHLWPGASNADTNLTSLVSELRTTLGEDPLAPRFVRTVHRYGYAFCSEVEGASLHSPRRPVRLRLYLEGREVALGEGDTLLGRGDDATVLVDASSVSRRHALIRVRDGRATVEDLGSRNGTFVRGERLAASCELADGDEIHLGHVPLTFRVLNTSAQSTGSGTPQRR